MELLHLPLFESPTKSSKDFHLFQFISHYDTFLLCPHVDLEFGVFISIVAFKDTHMHQTTMKKGTTLKKRLVGSTLRKKIQEEIQNLMIFADRIVANSSEMTHTRREIFHLLLCGAVHQSKTQPSTVKWSKADSLAQHFCECVCAWTITFWCLLFIKYHSEIAFDLIFSSFFYHILCKHFWNWKREGEREREK